MSGRSDNIFVGRGAGGGPRGIGAAGAQILVNFLINYDRGRLTQLTADIKKFEAEREAAAAKSAGINSRLVELDKKVTEAKRVQGVVGKANIAQLNAIATSQTKINSLVQKQRTGSEAVAQQLVAQRAHHSEIVGRLATETGFSDKQIRNAANLVALESRLETLSLDRQANEAEILRLTQQINVAKRQQESISGAGPSGVSRIGALGLGLLGGTIGGALVSGAILGPLQAVQDAVVDLFQNLLDGAKGSKEAVAELGTEIEQLADQEDISRLEAATKLIERMRGTGAAAQAGAGPLAQAGALTVIQEQVKSGQQLLDIIAGVNALEGNTTEQLNRQNVVFDSLLGKSRQEQELRTGALNKIEAAIQFQREWGNLIPLNAFFDLNGIANQVLGVTGDTVAATRAHALELKNATDQAAREAATLQDVANAMEYIANIQQSNIDRVGGAFLDSEVSSAEGAFDRSVQHFNQQATVAIAGITKQYQSAMAQVEAASNARIGALQNRLGNLELTPSGRTKRLEKQLDALKDAGPSKRTKELADQIERLNAAQEKAAYRISLASIAEQKHQLLLKERLRLTKGEIDLDDYKGEDRLIAIDALLARMQKQNEAQERFNKLLDIQYQMQQGVRRAQGETIQDFIARRAQYYRGLLQQAAELNREGPQAELEAEKARVEASVALKDLEERRRKLIEDHARQQRMKDLAEQLKASQDRDRKELEARRESLQKQLEASRKADQDALESRRAALQKQIEAERAATAQRIEALQAARDREIAIQNQARDNAIEQARVISDKLIAAYEARAEALAKWTNFGELQALTSAVKGTQNMQQLQALSGSVAGASWAMNYLKQTGQWMGLDPGSQATLLNNFTNLIRTYSQQLQHFYNPPRPPAGMAEGGIFRLNNSNTPLGRDMRWGDGQGDEIGVVLSNKVVQALREQGGAGGGPLIGGDVIFQSQDPYRDRYKLERTVRSMVREELN